MFKYTLRYWNNQGNPVTQEVDLYIEPENVTIVTAELTKAKSKYQTWLATFEGKIYPETLQTMITLAFNEMTPKYSKISVIKVIRVIDRSLGLKEAKEIADSIYKWGNEPCTPNFD